VRYSQIHALPLIACDCIYQLKDNVSLATLMAVSKAYRDRDKADGAAMKADRVMKVQQDRLQAKRIVAAYKVCASCVCCRGGRSRFFRLRSSFKSFDPDPDPESFQI